uniref:Reverse transcriptase domain-containing protein n=1 Tax=Tanacetum cinerariifolium TaxID=118510 RepID=A0A6L2M5J0_TANCI|nr:reverse transcriptase domain-containing protein [Tanacetum cinerariifolium]
MDKVRRDKRKEVHARLDFGVNSKERRTREDSHHSSARAQTTRPERLKVQDHLRYGDRHVLDRLGHRRQSTLDASNEGFPEDRKCFRGVGESYDDSYSRSYHDRARFRHMNRKMDNESPLSSVSKSDSSDGRDTKRNSRSRSKKVPVAATYGDPNRKEKQQQVLQLYNDKGHSTDESAVPKAVGARPKNFKVALHSDFPDQEVAIRGTLSAKGRTKLCSLLKENLDKFAWQPSDMTGVP